MVALLQRMQMALVQDLIEILLTGSKVKKKNDNIK
jgi:hypothetical protein